MKKKYKTALVIGRFQPLHKGHVFLIKKAVKLANQIIIVIGSANIKNNDNPFSLEERRLMIDEMLKVEKLERSIKEIVAVDDVPDDNEWLRVLLSKTGPVDVVVGNNDWVNGIFKSAGYEVLPTLLYKRQIYEGKKIRKKLRESGSIT